MFNPLILLAVEASGVIALPLAAHLLTRTRGPNERVVSAQALTRVC
jgi:hypothetical protein